MNKIEKLKEFIHNYNQNKENLKNQILEVPSSLNFSTYDYLYREQKHSAFEIVSKCTHLTEELENLKQQVLSSIQNFEKKLKPFIKEKMEFNKNIEIQLKKLDQEFSEFMKDYPELDYNSAICINRKRFDKEELSILENTYKKLNLVYIFEYGQDVIYYNSKNIKYNDLKDLIINSVNSEFVEIHDKINRYSNNSNINLNPLYGHNIEKIIKIISFNY